MRSASRPLALVFASLAILAGCTRVDVNSPQIRGIGYLRMDAIVKAHPLYPQLSQLDDAIAAINLAAAAPHVPRSAKEIAADTVVLNQQLTEARARANKILAQQQAEYGNKEQAAIAAALAAAGLGNAGANAARRMSATSAQQAQAAAQQANQDFLAFQQSVIAQDNAAVAQVSRQVQEAANEKYRARAAQLQQQESEQSLRLAQADAPERLSIKTKLNNLTMDDATRKHLTQQLSSLDRKERNAAAAERDRDRAALEGYRKQLQGQTSAAQAAAVAKISAQTRAKLSSRRNEVTTQLRSLGPAPLPPNLSPAMRSKIAAIHQQFSSAFRADAEKTVADYNATKTDLDRQYAALHGADVGATGAAAKQLAELQKRRSDLYDKIVAQIRSEAARIAARRGLKVVFGSVEGAVGGYDLTDEVSRDVESLHE